MPIRQTSNLFPSIRATAAALLLGASAAPVVAQLDLGKPGFPGQADAALVRMELVSEHDALVPGETNWLGLTFTIKPEWHTYWRNNGDTGAPMGLSFEAPEGVEIGEVVYPAPRRYLVAGGFVDYVYEHKVTLLVPVTAGPSLAPGDRVTIKVEADWLVCKEMCLAEDDAKELTLPVASVAEPTKARAEFEATRARVPRPMDEARAAGIETRWDSLALTLRAPGATSLVFYPYESEANAYPRDMAERGEARGDTITLQYDEKANDAANIAGVLEVRTPESTFWYELELGTPNAPR